MDSTSTEKPVIQWTLDREESLLVSALMATGFFYATGNIAALKQAVLSIHTHWENMGIEKANALQERFEKLTANAFSDVRKRDLMDAQCRAEGAHCTCSDDTCCFCGKSKLLNPL